MLLNDVFLKKTLDDVWTDGDKHDKNINIHPGQADLYKDGCRMTVYYLPILHVKCTFSNVHALLLCCFISISRSSNS